MLILSYFTCWRSWWLFFSLFTFVLLLTNQSSGVVALHLEDAGQLDFLVSTSGHGTTRFAHRSKSVLITSDSPFQSDQLGAPPPLTTNDNQSTPTLSSCYVAGRDLATGRLLWRRLVCAKKGGSISSKQQLQQQHVVAALGERFYTLDHTGIVRGWIASRGALIWDSPILSSAAAAAAAAATSSSLPPQNTPRLWLTQHDLIVAVLGPIFSVLDTRSGQILGTLNLNEVAAATTTANSRWKAPLSTSEATLQWIQVFASSSSSSTSDETKSSILQVVLGWVEPQPGRQHWIGRGSQTAVLELQVSPEGFVAPNAATPLSTTSSFVASLWYIIGSTAGAISSATSSKDLTWIPILSTNPQQQQEKQLSRPVDLSNVWQDLKWTSLERFQSLKSHSNLIRLTGPKPDGVRTMAFLEWEGEDGSQEASVTRQLVTPPSDDDATVLALAHCAAFDNTVVAFQQAATQQSSSPWRVWQVVSSSNLNSIPILGDVVPSANSSSLNLWNGDTVQDLITLACSANAMSVLLSTTGGSTRVITFTKTGKVVKSQIRWAAEEGLATVSSAVMVDASHIILEDDVSENKKKDPPLLVTSLDLPSRLEFHYKSLKSLFLSSPLAIFGANRNSRRRYREQAFGFVKIVVLLSKSSHRVWGMGTTHPHRGELVWTLPLPSQATWHTLVHGKASSAVGVNGVNGGTHSREVLILSNLVDSIQWHCIDGTTGVVHRQGAVPIPSSPIVQIVPLLGGASASSGACRQVALLLHQDKTITLVPQEDNAFDGLSSRAMAVHEIESSTKHGLFAHVVDQQHAKVEAFRIQVTGNGLFDAGLVGQTLFPGEDVVGLAYPIRDEIVQSPTMVLGDDSLLVKYLNPHLAVVVTFAASSNSNASKPLLLPNKAAKAKRKPLGVTPPSAKQQQQQKLGDAAAGAATTSDQDSPNLFVNIVDTVSGRVLHRASHVNAARPDQPSIPIVINENWVVYAFVNEKTRRTELGVLSLYEGMIDRNGITAFSSPEQTLAFSSLDARESKPVVLAKSFAFTKQVTALGVTVTRAGISTPHILIACGDDRIYAVDRRLLEPRRPAGELKESEKLEGLQQYRELLQVLSLQALTHNQTVEKVTSIISASTELESQSLILAYGGPDIFFTRTSPSRGFDLLPDSFNRILLSLVVLALLVALLVARSMAYKKIVKESWI